MHPRRGVHQNTIESYIVNEAQVCRHRQFQGEPQQRRRQVQSSKVAYESSLHRGSQRQVVHHVFCFLFADVDAACLAFRRLSLMRLRCLFKHSLHVFLSSSKCARSASIRLQVLHFRFSTSSGTSGTGVMGRSANIVESKGGRPSSSSILNRIRL